MAKKQEQEQFPQASTKFNINLGEAGIKTVSFGIAAFTRIKEDNAKVTSAFSVLEEMDELQIIPYLICCGIRPEERSWSNYEDFLDLYDACEDQEAINKVIPGYISAMGVLGKKLTPALDVVQKMYAAAGK
ncbi:hypothetical protein [Dyadobacter sandarakinus]|uniref:Uncharacterized protein n=1 Tax=Dyadobacter sandarakinus TaxID=2747268 RepID=A0ABX7I3A2_9BACT|nr:hypothetical protein [Dyadobacter sandarakinus]QRQ99717.1 hypothetical protein HWI92_01695 [Dyadobacter sandarakinus]